MAKHSSFLLEYSSTEQFSPVLGIWCFTYWFYTNTGRAECLTDRDICAKGETDVSGCGESQTVLQDPHQAHPLHRGGAQPTPESEVPHVVLVHHWQGKQQPFLGNFCLIHISVLHTFVDACVRAHIGMHA